MHIFLTAAMKIPNPPIAGMNYPLGATIAENGVNFSVFSKNASAMELVFFDNVDDTKPSRVIKLDPVKNKTFYYWHALVPNVEEGQLYGYRAYGKYVPTAGRWFDGSKVLLDPYGKSVAVGKNYRRSAAKKYGHDNCAESMKSVVVDPKNYDWEGDTTLQRPFSETVIYELHVGGFTKHESSGLPNEMRGTYKGLIEKIPYLQELGITAVELMPVMQFDHQDAPNGVNYWGYAPINFFSVHHAYGTTSDPIATMNEFRDMVKALHKAGIEVILDVVYNHTSEAGFNGTTQCFKGLENVAYYTFDHGTYNYSNYTGTGNTLNANHSIVRRMIMDSLRYWVSEMHVDGFRFDLASVLSRDEKGVPQENPPVLWEIESEPVLAGTKIIAEAWDAAGLYQVGKFIGDRWSEWNGVFRDDLRKFMKSDTYSVGGLAQRVTGSTDLFSNLNRDPNRSVNFITCHDGFTLNDLVSYNEKHNWENGEENRDGMNDNNAWNCGVEGPTDDPEIEKVRLRQIKNFFTLLMLCQGTPMILMGDEIRRTQNGNNNAYCQDNELSWFNWDDVKAHNGLFRFVQGLIKTYEKFSVLREERFWVDDKDPGSPSLTWHGVKLNEPDWGEHSHTLAFTLEDKSSQQYLHVMINAYWEDLTFEIPAYTEKKHVKWRRLVDTSRNSPQDFMELETAHIVDIDHLMLKDRSVVVLASEDVEG